jgi:ATP-dependent Clp protease adaptor protein ClpS
MAEKIILKKEKQIKEIINEPGHYAVILYNDSYTTMDFVVFILMEIFHKTETEANRLMLEVHIKGKSKIGSYTFDIAATKVEDVNFRSEKAGFPLKCTMEKEE